MARLNSSRPALLWFLGVGAVLALGAGAATAGWLRHGDAIFLSLAGAGWTNCF